MPNPTYVSLRAMMAEREAQLAAATRAATSSSPTSPSSASRQSTEPGLAAEQTRLTRDYEVLKQQYDQLLANREQVRLRSDVQTRTSPLTIQVVEPPSVPSVPAAPNRPIFLTADPDRRARRRRRRRLRRRPAADHLPDPEPARRGDRPAGARHGQRGGDARPSALRRRQRLLWLGGAGGGARRQLRDPDPGRILAAKHGGVRNDMKHSRISLLERAAEVYDFGAALRAPRRAGARCRAAVRRAPSAEPAPRPRRSSRRAEPPPAPRRAVAPAAEPPAPRPRRPRRGASPRSIATRWPRPASSFPRRRRPASPRSSG